MEAMSLPDLRISLITVPNIFPSINLIAFLGLNGLTEFRYIIFIYQNAYRFSFK
jgi:hypothetical protein